MKLHKKYTILACGERKNVAMDNNKVQTIITAIFLAKIVFVETFAIEFIIPKSANSAKIDKVIFV